MSAQDDNDDASTLRKILNSSWVQIAMAASVISYQVQKLDVRMERMESSSISMQINGAQLSQDMASLKGARAARDIEMAEIRRQISVLTERLIRLEANTPAFPQGRR